MYENVTGQKLNLTIFVNLKYFVFNGIKKTKSLNLIQYIYVCVMCILRKFKLLNRLNCSEKNVRAKNLTNFTLCKIVVNVKYILY